MSNLIDKLDYLLICMGTVVSITNIEHILGIIILVIQFIWILTKLIFKIRSYIKNNKDLSELDTEVDSIIDELEDLTHEHRQDKQS